MSSDAHTDHREQVLGVLAQRCRWLGAADRETIFRSLVLESERDAPVRPPWELHQELVDTAVQKAVEQGKRAWRAHSAELTTPAAVAALAARNPDAHPSAGFVARLRKRPAVMCAASFALACGGAASLSVATVRSAIASMLDGATHAVPASAPASTAEREQHARNAAARSAGRARRAARRAAASAASHRDAARDPRPFSLEIAAPPAPPPPPPAAAGGEFGLETQPAPAPRSRPTPEELEFGLERATP